MENLTIKSRLIFTPGWKYIYAGSQFAVWRFTPGKDFNAIVFIDMVSNLLTLHPYSTGIDFSRQNLTSVQTTTKVDPRAVRVKIFLMVVDQ